MARDGAVGTEQGNSAVWWSWVHQHPKEARMYGFCLSKATESSLFFSVMDMRFELVLPSHFCDGGDEGEGCFLAMSPDASAGEAFVTHLNEKLERIPCRSDPVGAVHQVLDVFVKMIEITSGKRKRPRSGGEEEEDTAQVSSGSEFESDFGGEDCMSEDSGVVLPGDEDDEDAEYEFAMKGPPANDLSFLNEDAGLNCRGHAAAAQEARGICEAARAASVGGSRGQLGNLPSWWERAQQDMLKFCVVSTSSDAETVHLRLQVPGLIDDEAVASAIGLSFDATLCISVQFERRLMQSDSPRSRSQPLLAQQVVVRQLQLAKPSQSTPLQLSSPSQSTADPESYVKGFYKVYKDEATDSEASPGYARAVLLPELVVFFISHRANRTDTTGIRSEPLKNEQMRKYLDACAGMMNPFIGLLCFIGSQLRALPTWCPVCWCSLPESMWRLRTCSKEFCLYKFEELGQGSGVFHEISKSPKVVELELALAYGAAVSGRDVFEPFPNSFLEGNELRGRAGWFTTTDPSSQRQGSEGVRNKTRQAIQSRIQAQLSIVDKNLQPSPQNKNLQFLTQILLSLPPLDELKECRDERSLRRKLAYSRYGQLASQGNDMKTVKAKDLDLTYELLRFILSTNRVSIRGLEESEMLPFDSDVTHQFVVVHDSPEKEETFQKLRQMAGGSFFAFHGSNPCNWYSILRNGLRSMSKTAYMSSGDSYGQGIYLADNFDLSFSYSTLRVQDDKIPWKFGGTLEWPFSVLAICEVVNGSTQAFLERGIHVVPPTKQDNVLVRYLLVCASFSKRSAGFKISGTRLTTTAAAPPAPTFPGPLTVSGLAGSLLRYPDGASGVAGVDLLVHLQNLKVADSEKHKLQLEQQRATALKTLKEDIARLTAEKSFSKLNVKGELAKVGEDQKKSRTGEGTATATHAITKEHRNIMKEIQKEKLKASASGGGAASFLSNISIEIPDESNFYTWHVRLDKQLFKAYPLYKDLTDWAGRRKDEEAHVLLEVTFPGRFPFQPPFIRVVYPKFIFHTGHVTIGGSICMELLTESGWNPACSFELVLVQIVNALIEGGGRIDKAAIGQSYSALEAKSAFERVAGQHGWKISRT